MAASSTIPSNSPIFQLLCSLHRNDRAAQIFHREPDLLRFIFTSDVLEFYVFVGNSKAQILLLSTLLHLP